jgi:hypothetical protein
MGWGGGGGVGKITTKISQECMNAINIYETKTKYCII